MRIKSLVGACIAGAFCMASAHAAPVVIDFTAPDQILNGGSYEEDGFVVEPTVISNFAEIRDSELTAEAFLSRQQPDTYSITRVGGGVFTFTSFDYRSAIPSIVNGVLIDEFQVLGFLNGVQIQDYGVYQTNLTTLITVNILANAIEIDELRLVATGNSGGAGPSWDNFVFEVAEVPLPAALPLFLIGLAGLGFAKRRRKA